MAGYRESIPGQEPNVTQKAALRAGAARNFPGHSLVGGIYQGRDGGLYYEKNGRLWPLSGGGAGARGSGESTDASGRAANDAASIARAAQTDAATAQVTAEEALADAAVAQTTADNAIVDPGGDEGDTLRRRSGEWVGEAFPTTTGGELITAFVTGDTTMAPNRRYMVSIASPGIAAMLLPPSATRGDVIEILGVSSGKWKITQGSGQLIRRYGSLTTSGVTGYIGCDQAYCTVRLVCIIDNTTWQIQYDGPAGQINVN